MGTEPWYTPRGPNRARMLSNIPRTWILTGVAGFLVLLFLGSLHTKQSLFPSTQLPFDELIRQLWQTEKLDVTAPVFVDQDGDTFRLPREPVFTTKLGKRVVILDIDTRPFGLQGQLLNPLPWDWNKVESLSAGMMSHYLYSVIHGYDYKLVRSPKYADRHDAWGKVLMTERALNNHDFVIFMDSDAVIANPEVPIEWLLNYWHVTRNTSMTLASDPDLDKNKDSMGKVATNTGFLLVQNLPTTHEMFRKWAECPDEQHYSGCSSWKWGGLKDQSAFSEYVRYEYKDSIKVIPCSEGNGYPENHDDPQCKGIFLRHHWLDKGLTKDKFAHNVMRMFAPRIHRHYMDKYNEIVEDLRDKELVGSHIIEGNLH